MPSSLSELTPIVFNMELTHFGLEDSISTSNLHIVKCLGIQIRSQMTVIKLGISSASHERNSFIIFVGQLQVIRNCMNLNSNINLYRGL